MIDRSGSRGITKVDNLQDNSVIENAFSSAYDDAFNKEVIVEEFIDGDEYSCEAISYDGHHTILGITKKFTTGAPHFIELGHISQASLADDKKLEVQQIIVKALDCLQVRFGASHSEFKITPNGEIKIIEIGSRMGGDCIGSDLVGLSTGYDFLKMIIEVAVSKQPTIKKTLPMYPYSAIRFSFSLDDTRLIQEIEKEYPEIIRQKIIPGEVKKVTDSSMRMGFIIATFDDYNQAARILGLGE